MNTHHRELKLVALICTHNRSSLLMEAISSINEAFHPKNCTIELFVIVNACTDNTLELINNYSQDDELLPLRYAIEPRAGKSFALNHAINSLNNVFICFIDDDQKVDKNYFLETINAINKFPDTSIICGRLLPDWIGDEPAWIHDNIKYKIYPFPIPIFDLGDISLKININMELPPGGQIIIHSSVFDVFGQFSEDLGPKGHNLMGSEDTDFFQRVLNNGGTIQYEPKIVQYHFVDKNRLKLTYLTKKCFQRNRSITISRPNFYSSPPFYLIRILFNNILYLLLSSNSSQFRFYLMRLCSTLGEITGVIQIYFFKSINS